MNDSIIRVIDWKQTNARESANHQLVFFMRYQTVSFIKLSTTRIETCLHCCAAAAVLQSARSRTAGNCHREPEAPDVDSSRSPLLLTKKTISLSNLIFNNY